jgi:hypothetical protein
MIRSNAASLKQLVYFLEHIQRTTDYALAFERATMLVCLKNKNHAENSWSMSVRTASSSRKPAAASINHIPLSCIMNVHRKRLCKSLDQRLCALAIRKQLLLQSFVRTLACKICHF